MAPWQEWVAQLPAWERVCAAQHSTLAASVQTYLAREAVHSATTAKVVYAQDFMARDGQLGCGSGIEVAQWSDAAPLTRPEQVSCIEIHRHVED